ncbi:hypothetical protein LJR219_003510 [Phenylobacterium sp. LjRoot219]|uniref:transporter n=1 Tax=Phenylobacterium sp. LjRoot219 TaxID=3342283 RepID=UPI003ECE3416
MNFVIVGYARSWGGVSFDTSLPLTDPKLRIDGPILAYARSIDLWGKSGKVDVILPTGRLSGRALYQGEPVQREVSGLGDPLLRLSVSLIGAPALDAAEFRAYRPDLIVGASVQVSAPLGQYDSDRLVNLGAHRWWVKPEIGASKTLGRWTVEGKAAVTFYTVNRDFFGGNRRSQSPLYSAQGHLIYSFAGGAWGSLDATYFTGGRTTLNDVVNRDLQRNWRVGVTLARPVTRRHSIKLNASRGVSARTGNDYDQVGVAWQYRWGAGL